MNKHYKNIRSKHKTIQGKIMKKFLLMASITSILSISQLSLASPSGITIPGNYENIEQSNGAILYKSSNYYVILVDFEHAKLDFGNIKKSSKQTNQWHTEYVKKEQDDFWKQDSSATTFAFFNGQFFDPSNRDVEH